MLPDLLLRAEEIALRDEVRTFVSERVPADPIKLMDRNKIVEKVVGTMPSVCAARSHGEER